MLTAITRAVSPSMEMCELTHREREPIDIARAGQQHRAYEACLRELGVQVVALEAEPAYPDSVFVEDAGIVLDETAVMTRLGAASRRGESDTLARELEWYRPLCWMREPATLDGGDVILAGKTLYVGVTVRSNAEGIGQLAALVAQFGYDVRPVTVQGCLHLKSACSYIGDTVLVHRPWVDAAVFAGLHVLDVPEECGANVLAIGDTVVISSSAPRTAEMLSGLGWGVRVLDNSELMKAEGALTCCSLIFQS
jgi:dimethylargininase